MGALNSLRPAVDGLVRNPILVVVTGAFALLQLPQLLLQSQNPLLAAVVSLVLSGVLILLVPFYQGGVLGMGREALTGRTALDTFLREGKSNYVALLLGYFVLLAVNAVFGILGYGGAIIAFVAFQSGGDPGTAFYAILAVAAVVFVLAYLLVVFFVQFYAHAIVVDDTGVLDGFERSVGLVRSHLVSVLGYSLLVGVASGVAGGVAALASFVFVPEQTTLPLPDPTIPVLVGGALVYLVGIALLSAFWATYSVAFYQRLDASVT